MARKMARAEPSASAGAMAGRKTRTTEATEARAMKSKSRQA